MRLFALLLVSVAACIAPACSSFDAEATPDDGDGGSDAAGDGAAPNAEGGGDAASGSDAGLPVLVVVAQEKGAVRSIATDVNHIYWWSVDQSSIMRADKSTPSASTRLAIRPGQAVSAVAVDGSGVYWLESGPDAIDGGRTDRIMMLTPNGSSPSTLYTTPDPLKLLALGDGVLSTFSGGIVRVKDGSSGEPVAVGIDQDALAADGTDAFYSYGNGLVYRLTAANVPLQVIAVPSPRELKVESANLYGVYAADGGTVVFKTDKTETMANATAATELTHVSGGPVYLAIDSLGVVFANAGNGTIKRVSRNGGNPTLIVSDKSGINAVAADAQGVYWTTDSGEVGWATR